MYCYSSFSRNDCWRTFSWPYKHFAFSVDGESHCFHCFDCIVLLLCDQIIPSDPCLIVTSHRSFFTILSISSCFWFLMTKNYLSQCHRIFWESEYQLNYSEGLLVECPVECSQMQCCWFEHVDTIQPRSISTVHAE